MAVDGSRVVAQYSIERNGAGVRLLKIDRLILGNIKTRPVDGRALGTLHDISNRSGLNDGRLTTNDHSVLRSSVYSRKLPAASRHVHGIRRNNKTGCESGSGPFFGMRF
ncbi:MAG: hypothetical protein WCP79_15500 [Bacillota bacterium]